MSSNILQSIREDDFVEYFLFPKLTSNSEEETLDDLEVELKNLYEKINRFSIKYCEKYIWHKDAFHIVARYENSNLLFENDDGETEKLPAHFHGISHYGDNIQDEWFIVSLLRRLTMEIPDLIVRIVDSDGEFLLIESAEHLPKWASPETCAQRVYIFNGSFHLVQNSPSNTTTLLKVSDAIRKLRQNPTLYRVTEAMEICILDRLDGYPDKTKDDLHHSVVYVPLGVAALLKHKPSLISSACRAFCNRDMIDMRACKAMRYFPPENRVYAPATFSKCLYAMLIHNNYNPDRRTGWNLPPVNQPEYKSHSLGVKLACGFEILASQAKPFQKVEDDKGWERYLESLKKKGYFQENIEGSKDYNRLLELSKTYYIDNRDSMNYAPGIGREILSLLKSLDYSTDEFSTEFNEEDVDDDSWLDITPEALDEMLTSRYGVKKLFSLNGNIDASNFTNNITEFLEQKSEFDAIDEPSDLSPPVRPKRGVKKNSFSSESNQKPINKQKDGGANSGGGGGDDEKIDFDPEGFQNHVKNLLDLIIPEDNWESNSEMSDYEDDDDIDKSISDMSSTGDIKTNLKKYMDQMDLELSKTTIGKSFEKKKQQPKQTATMATGDESFDDIESFTPVDIDMNALKNIVESYQSQLGGPGPASTLLTSMKMGIQTTKEKSDDLTNEKTVTDV